MLLQLWNLRKHGQNAADRRRYAIAEYIPLYFSCAVANCISRYDLRMNLQGFSLA